MKTVDRQESLRSARRSLAGPGLWALVAACALALSLATPRARAQAQRPRFKVTRCDLEAELFPSTHMLAAKARVEFAPEAELSTLNFELNSALKIEEVADSSNQSLRFRQEGLNFRVDFPTPLPAGQSHSFTVVYRGALASAEGSPVENLKLAYVAPEGSYLLYAARWFPVSGYGVNRFAATLRITVPSDEVVIASGKPLAMVRQAGKVTYTFQYDQPSFPGTVLAGRYLVRPAVGAGGNVTVYVKEGHETLAAPYGAAAGKILVYYSDLFGALPSNRLSLVEIDDGTVGGYAAPEMVTIASRGLTTPINDRLLAHEISRQWWSCLVSPASRNEAYLDEGLATYSAAMYVEESAGEEAFEGVMREAQIGALTHESVAPVSQAGSLQDFTPEYHSVVLQKGAMVFHMLRWVIGDAAFQKTLRAVVHQYAWKSISTSDFQNVAEKVSSQSLTYFFAQWVSSTGVPQFKRSWAVYKTGQGYQVVGKIQQDLDIFRMPVEIRVYCEGTKPVNERVEMVGTTADFTVNTRTKPLRVVVDPVSRILKYDDRIRLQVEMARADQLVQQQAYLEALKQYQSVLEINRNSSLAHYRIGEVHFRLHNYTAAMEAFRDALNGDLDPKWTEVWSHIMLGKIFDVTGQRDRALNEYQRALQTRDDSQGALEEANRYIQKPYVEEGRPAG